MTIRAAFLDSANATRGLLADPAVASAWAHPSALVGMTVGALAGHLARAVVTVDGYLDRPEPPLPPDLDAPGYLLSIDGLSGPTGPDLDSDLHRGIRERAAEEASAGIVDLLERWDSAVARLRHRLPVEPHTRAVAVLGGRALQLDDYLVTRMLELVVHADDLADSTGAALPAYPAAAWETVIACLVETARRRHGPAAVVRAMTRVERDGVRALRVL